MDFKLREESCRNYNLNSQSGRSSLRCTSEDNYNAVMANFGLDPTAGSEALARGQNVSAFLDSIQASEGKEEEEEDGSTSKEEDK